MHTLPVLSALSAPGQCGEARCLRHLFHAQSGGSGKLLACILAPLPPIILEILLSMRASSSPGTRPHYLAALCLCAYRAKLGAMWASGQERSRQGALNVLLAPAVARPPFGARPAAAATTPHSRARYAACFVLQISHPILFYFNG